jgi:sugar-phosphatase
LQSLHGASSRSIGAGTTQDAGVADAGPVTSAGAVALRCRGLLFDADGVLVDSDASIERAWVRWAHRWDHDPATVLAGIHGRRSDDTVAQLVDHADRARALGDIDRFELEDVGAVTACPGAAELLAALPAGSWAVVTSGKRELASARLAAAGLPLPTVLVPADEVPRGKPDPAGYLLGARGLGLPPADCVVLEDSPAGIAAGIAAGAAVVGVSERALAGDVAVVVRDLRGLTWDGAALRVPAEALLRG